MVKDLMGYEKYKIIRYKHKEKEYLQDLDKYIWTKKYYESLDLPMYSAEPLICHLKMNVDKNIDIEKMEGEI